MTKKKYKKVLIIRFSSIGDIVLTTPIIRCLKKQLEGEVHFLTKKSFQSILSRNPYLDKIFTIEKKVGEVLPQLKAEEYDAIIDLHKNLRTWKVRWALRVPYFTFDKINWEKWLIVNLKVNRLPKIHIVNRYFQSVFPLKVKNDGAGLDFFIEKKESSSKDYIAFAVGGAHATKRLPEEKIIEICSKINVPVFLLGGKTDATIGEKVVLSVKSNRIINLCGKTSLEESAEIIKNAKKVITHDTGMMHIAAAFQKEIISIWGNTIPEFGMTPFYPKNMDKNTSVEVKNLPCRPCSKIGHERCPKGHFRCMMKMDVDNIVELASNKRMK